MLKIFSTQPARFLISSLVIIAVWLPAVESTGKSRIKDIASFEGIRDNILLGYGLVVGLKGTGDTLRNAPFTKQSLEAMLERLGVNVRNANLKSNNVAAVMVTANLPPFARQGSRIDVKVSSLGDADSLQGGILLATPLVGADGEVYAVSQGSVAVAGFSAGGDAESVVQGVPTNGQVPNGAVVEREIDFELGKLRQFRLALRNPDVTTAKRIALKINGHYKELMAQALDPGTVLVRAPANKGGIFNILAVIEQLKVQPDQIAKVVINQSSGVIVIGADVRVDEIAIAQGNLTIRVSETPQVSQPNPLSQGGQTAVVPRSNVQVTEKNTRLATLKTGVSLQELVDGLNALGVGPRDLISILQTIKAAGALQAEIIVR